MKPLLFLSILTLILSACSKDENLIGTYTSDRYNFLEMASKSLFQKTGFSAGCTIELNEDSSFVYTTCGNIMKGYWTIQVDSLILDIHSNKWIVDSLQIHGYKGRWPKSCYSQVFSIEGDHLLQLRNENPDIEGDYRVFTRLKKIED